MKELLMRTDESWVSLIVRVVLGVVMLPHGLQKTLGWFGGSGFTGTLSAFDQYFGVPAALTVLVIAAESLGALGLLAGLLTRVSAFGLIAVMLGAVFMSHIEHGFFMNWGGGQGGEGIEYHLLVIGMSAGLLVGGGGRWSVDGMLAGDGR
jgi:putative oxidoreductase